MSFHRTLQDMNLYSEGNEYRGCAKSVTLPKLVLKLNELRLGSGTVKVLNGDEALSLEFTLNSPEMSILRQYARPGIAGTYIRFAGAWQREDTGAVDTCEVTVRGRYEEMDLGEFKIGEEGDFKHKFACAYFRFEWNGEEIIERDLLNYVFRVGGVDRLADINAAIS
jgi:uncharacterized protein